ncbi:MAG TPA: hypothetical protein VFZ04_21470 [Longimicrobiales bacterium]
MKPVTLAVIALAAFAGADVAQSQTIEITPHLGMHMPVGLLLEGRDETDNSFVRRRQLGAITVGARFTLHATERFHLESNTTYSPSLVAITDRTQTVDLRGRVFMGHVKALYRFAQISSGWSFWGGTGLGVVSRHGDGWADMRGTTDAALVLAGKARLARLNSSKSFVLAVEDYVTRAAFENTNASTSPRIHHDVVYSFGMSIPLTR